MKNRYNVFGLLMIILSLTCYTLPAFSQAVEAVAEINKSEHPVFKNTYAYPPETVKGALLEQLQKDRIPARPGKHTVTCKAVVYTVLASAPLDLYFQIDGKSRKGKGTATLKLFISKGRDNFIGKKYDPQLSGKALDFLNNLQKEVSYYALKLEVHQKEKDLEEAQSDYNKLLKDKQKLSGKKYDFKRSLSAERDAKARKKLRKKVHKTDKKINAATDDIQKAEDNLEQSKGEIQALRNRLMQLYRENDHSEK